MKSNATKNTDIQQLKNKIAELEQYKTDQNTKALNKRIKELENTITDFRKGEESLPEILKSFHKITRKENTIYSINDFDIQCRFTYVSPSVKFLGGYDPEELIGKSVFDYIHPDDKKTIVLPLLKTYLKYKVNNLLKGELKNQSKTFVYRLKDKDGNWRYAETTSNYVGNKLVNITTDIGEKKEFEKKIQQTKVDYNNLLNNLSDIYYRISKEGLITDINPAVKEVSGYSCNELIGKPVKTLFKNQKNRHDFINAIKEKGIVKNYKLEFTSKDGNKIYVGANAYILKDDDGNPIGIEGILHNSTEHYLAENKLKESEKKFRNFVETSADLLIRLTKTGYIEYVSPRILERYGYQPDELIGKHLKFTTPSTEIPKAMKIIKTLLSGKSVMNIEITQKDKAGNIIPVEINAAPVIKDGKIVGMQGILRDITKRKQAENLLLAQHNLALKLNTTTGLDEILNLCLDSAISISKMDCGGIYLVDEEKGSLELKNHKGLSTDFVKSSSYYTADSPSTKLIMKGEPIYSQHKRLNVKLNDVREKENLKAIAIIPINFEGKVIACFNISSHTLDEVPVYSRNVLETIAGQIGGVLSRVKAENKLRESERRLTLAVEGTGLGLWDQDFSSGKIIRNEHWSKMLGYELDEIKKSKLAWKELIHPDDLATLEKTIQEHEQERISIFSVEHRMRTKNGEWKWIHNWGKVVERDKNGKPLRAIGVHFDINDRKLAEQQIKQKSLELEKQYISSEKQRIATLSVLSDLNETTKQLLSEIDERKKSAKELETANKNLVLMGETISSMNECVSISDIEHKIIFVNEAFTKTYGYKKEKIIGKTSQLIRVKEQSEFTDEIRKKSEKDGWKGELLNRKKDGTIFPIELSITPLRDKNSKNIAYIGISSDITERIQAEEALLESENSLRTLFNTMTDIVMEVDYDGRYIYIAPTSEKLLFKSPEEIIGKTLHEVFPKPVADKFLKFIRKCLDENKKNIIEYPLIINEKEIWFEGRVTPKTKNSVLYIARDITERKLAETALKDNENKLKQAQKIAKLGHYSLNITTGQWTNSDVLDDIFGIDNKYNRDLAGWLNIIHPDYTEIMANYLQDDMLKKHRKFDKEYKIINIKTKQEMWVHGLGDIKFDENNNPIEMFGTIGDITERKQVEKALLDSEVKYRKFFMEDLTGDYLTTREGKIIDCNPQFLKIFGFKSLIQAQKYNATKLYVSKSAREKFIRKLEKNKILYDEQSELYNVNEEKIIIQENVIGEFDDGKLINIRGYLLDITKSEKAEREVRKLSTAVEQSPVSIVITGTDGVIEYVNPTFEKVTGYTFAEAIGLKPSVLKSGVTPDGEYRKLWETIIKGKVWTGEFLNKKKNGELYWESATISPIMDANNNISHYLAVKEDITEQKNIISELMNREEKYRTLTQNLNTGVYRNSPGENGKFLEANPAFLNIFGFRNRNELDRFKMADLYPDPDATKKIEEKLTLKGFLMNEEIQMRKKDGTLFYASISTTAAKDELGNVTHFDGIIEDITERKAMLEQIIQERDKSQLYLDIAGVMFLALDRRGDIILANQKACEIIGTTEEAIIGKNWFDNYIPKDVHLDIKDVFNNLMNGKEKLVQFHENEILTANGEIRLIEWRNNVLKDDSDKIIGIISSGLDITERKEDEDLRNKLYETSRNLAESLDIDKVLLRMSKQARSLLKCNGVTVYMVEDDKKTLKPVMAYDPPYTKQILTTKIGIDNSFTGQAVKEKKGKIFNYHDNIKGAFHIKGTPETDTDNIIVSPLEIDGEIIGALTLVRSKIPFTDKDLSIVNTFAVYGSTAIKNANSHQQLQHEIGERIQTEELLKESRDRYESIFNGVTDGIVYTDLKGNILSVNSALCKIIGIKKDNLIGKNGIELAKQVLPKKSVIKNISFIAKVLKGKTVDGFLIKYKNKSLELYIPKEEDKPGITVMVRDITERNKARENILNYQSDLKSLTNDLIITEERAKRRLAITLHDKLGQYLALANFKTNELNKLTKNDKNKKIIAEITSFIDNAIKESRDITYELSPPVLYEMGLIPAISWKLDEIEKNNKIKTLLINQSKSYEFGKREQIILYRGINELLQNVLKHSKAENVNVSFRLLTNICRITVTDNGIGYDLTTMRDKAVSQKKFGLFSIIERVKYIGGEVNIDSVPKKGTKVVIDIPIRN